METVLEWLYARHPHLTGTLGPDDDLIESRIVDSLRFIEFIYVLEEATGRSIDVRAHSIEDFRTLRGIERRFFSSTGAVAQSGRD